MSKYQVIWRGFVGGSTGYDRASREYLLALDRLGIDVKVQAMTYSDSIFVDGLNPEQVKRITELIEKPEATDKPKILVYHAQPNGVDPIAERQRYDKVVILTVWETTKVPDNWIAPANAADAVIVPCSQNVQALTDSGINVPIYMVPHGADFNTYKPENPPLPLANIQGKFTFLSVFQWQHRKAPEVLLQAYWSEFTPKDNVCLIIKSYYGSHVYTREQNRQIAQTIASYKEYIQRKSGITETAPIFLSTSVFDDEDLKGLYTLADCFVLPTRGEGVGLPYIESLCSGVPVIATGWGGSMDFLSKDNAYLIDYELEPTDSRLQTAISPSYNQLFTHEMKWAEPNVDSLRLQMRRAYENRELTKQKGINGRKLMEHMSWDESGKSFKNALDAICKQ
jgi:glycosyltransferase involved in cell wall biosynthesis